jgi:hypothetical protein
MPVFQGWKKLPLVLCLLYSIWSWGKGTKDLPFDPPMWVRLCTVIEKFSRYVSETTFPGGFDKAWCTEKVRISLTNADKMQGSACASSDTPPDRQTEKGHPRGIWLIAEHIGARF